MLTIHKEIEYLVKAMEVGVEGYVLKDSDSSVLRQAIYSVYKGDKFIQPELAPLLNKRKIEKEEINNSLEVPLTEREIQVIKLLTEGMYNKEIASILGISERTVKIMFQKSLEK